MWTRRKLIGTAVTGATGLALAAAHHAAAGQISSSGDQEHPGAMRKTCCDTCGDCAKACNKAYHHCMTQAAAGKTAHIKMAQMAADCAAFCALSSELLARNSSLAMLSCNACASACRRCASECAAFDTDLDMKMCQQECQRCEESCRKMIKAMDDGRTNEHHQPAAGRPTRIPNRRP